MAVLNKLCRLMPLAMVVAAPWGLWAQTPAEMAAILARLDKLERENHELSAEVKALRARLDGEPVETAADGSNGGSAAADSAEAAPAHDAPAAAPQPLEDKMAIAQQRIEELNQTKVEASEHFPIRLTGMALFNAYSNSKQGGGLEYPVTAANTAAASAGATFRQTIIGLDFRGPGTFLGGTVHGNVYMDLFGTGIGLRMRTGEIEVQWQSRSIMFGVEKPIFNPREPSSLAQMGVSPLTGTGNLWLWLPQARVEQDFRFGQSSGLRAQMGVIATREVGPYAGTNFTGTVEAVRPGLEGRYELFHNLDDSRHLEFAAGFHTSVTHAGGQSIDSNLVSLDWGFNPLRRVEFTGAFYSGQNVAPLGEGYQQGFGFRYREAYAVHSRGGWGQLTFHLLPRLDLHVFSGQQNDDADDLTSGRIARNLLYGGNLYFRLAPNVLLGWEATQLRTVYLGQGVRINNHYDLALAYLF